jgi:predicted transcriptional regulator
MKITKSNGFRQEYCGTVVKIGEILPIEGRDRIVKTMVNGLSIVIGKDEFQTGDVAVYCANETQLHELFLHLNSMYDDKELNIDKEKKGYINKHGRVRIVKLGGVPSYGILLNPTSIATFLNESVAAVSDYLKEHVGEDFDEINGEIFCKVYVPPVKHVNRQMSKSERRDKKLARFKMLIEGSFRLHYDTDQLARNIHEFSPEDKVFISNKLHGTSIIISNILTNVPTNWFKRMWRKLTGKYEYDQKYNIVYSSRNVIKNEFINPKQKAGGFYSDDIWGYWAEKLSAHIPQDFCIYGEVVGYTPNGTPIQKGYDYGCLPTDEVKSKLMVYRITQNDKELEIPDVIAFGQYLKDKLGDIVLDFPLMYHGTLADLYPEISTTEHWHENVLEALKVEKRFLMEQMEPMCINKVPREGFVIRKANDPIKEAWKLKCFKYFERERAAIDNGEIDMEMAEGYAEN